VNKLIQQSMRTDKRQLGKQLTVKNHHVTMRYTGSWIWRGCCKYGWIS